MKSFLNNNREMPSDSIFYNGGFIGKNVEYTPENEYNVGVVPFEVVGTATQSSLDATSITFPSGLQKRDVVILCFFMSSDATYYRMPDTPSGWTILDQTPTANIGNNREIYSIFYKAMGATPDTSISGLTAASPVGIWVSFALRGVNMFSSVNVIANSINSSGNIIFSSVDLSSVSNPSYVLAFALLDDRVTSGGVDSPIGVSSGYTSIIDSVFGSNFDGGAFSIGYKQVTSASETPGTIIPPLADVSTTITVGLNIFYDRSGVWKSTHSFIN